MSFRLEAPEDEPFLRRLIVETLTEQLNAQSWPEPMRARLLDIQYTTRRQAGRAHARDAESRIILADGQDAGWMLVAVLEDEIRLVEIMILAGHRGKGIGSTCIHEVLAAAARVNKPVRLRVDVPNSRAIALYERLGFRPIGGDEVQHLMERMPGEPIPGAP